MAKFGKVKRLDRDGTQSRNYYCRVTAANGKRAWRSTGQTTRKAADEQVDTWRLRDAKGERFVQEGTLLADAVDQWFEGKEARVSASCRTVYGVYVRSWKKWFRGRTLREVAAGDIERYLASRDVSARSKNNEKNTLRSFLAWCHRTELIPRNPAEAVEKFPETKRKIRTLSEVDEKRLLKAAREHDESVYGFILCLVQSGLRRGAVSALEWSDIDFRRGEWRIPAAKMKSREDFTGRPIADELFAWLRERRGPAGLVFGRLAADDWKAVIDKAGLDGLKPHDLRRSFITRCRRQGVAMEVCMNLSDHRDVSVVLACYREVDPEESREALAKVFGGGA